MREQLGRRETQVVGLIASGLKNQEIADLLGISVHTVRAHLSRVYLKLDVHTRGGAVAAALRKGYIE